MLPRLLAILKPIFFKNSCDTISEKDGFLVLLIILTVIFGVSTPSKTVNNV